MTNMGYKQTLYWANEAKYGSAAVINRPIGLVQSVNPTETNNLIKIRTLGGTRDYNNIVPGKFEISGSLEYFLQGGAFLRQAMGEDTASTATVDSGFNTVHITHLSASIKDIPTCLPLRIHIRVSVQPNISFW